MMAKAPITIDLKTDPQMSEAFKKLTPSLEKAAAQLKKFGSLSSGMKAGTQSFTESLNAMKASIEQLKSGPLTLKEIEESEFMMALKHVSSASQAMQSKYDVQKLAAVVYLAGGSVTIPMAQIEEANFIFGDNASFYQKLLSTPAIQKWETSGWETWANYPFEVEVMKNPMDLSITIYVKTKEIQFNGFDFGAGEDMTTISLVQPKLEYLYHYDISGKHIKIAVQAGKGGPLLSGASGSFMQEFDKALLDGFSKGKKVSGLDSIHWLFVGGPVHGETRWIKGNVMVTSMAVAEPLIPKGHSIPPGKHPMLMHKQIAYQGHDIVVDGYRYRIGTQTQEDFSAVPMDEFGKYIEEVGLTPYAQY